MSTANTGPERETPLLAGAPQATAETPSGAAGFALEVSPDADTVVRVDRDWVAAQDLALSFGVEGFGAETPADLATDVLAPVKRYEIIERLAKGGMGEVFRVRDRRLGRVVALKRLRSDWHRSRVAVQRFWEEARAIASLNHYNIVQVYDVGQDEQGYYIVMEYVHGEPLSQVLRRAGAQPLAYALALGQQLCQALEVAHGQGVLHRDIKPSNILLTPEGVPKLVDFGLAARLAEDDGSSAGYRMGTPLYAAPEQFSDPRRTDVRADVYALAATLYEVLTGQTPRRIEAERLPDAMRPVLRKALAERAEERYASIREFAQALENVGAAQRPVDMADGEAPARMICPSCGHESGGHVEFCGACGEDLKRARVIQRLLARGRALLDARQREDALRHYEAVLQLVPDHLEARSTILAIRQTLARLAATRAEANRLAARGHLRQALDKWRQLVGVDADDSEARAQIRKCQEQLRAQQIEKLLGEVPRCVEALRFDAATRRCDAVLKADPNNAEALELKPLIPKAKRLWIRGVIRCGVVAYQAGDYASAYSRFYEAYCHAEDCANDEELDRLREGVEMARLVPALHSLFDWGRSYTLVVEQLEHLMRSYTSPRAQEVIACTRARFEDAYWVAMARRARRQQDEWEARRARRWRIAGLILAGLVACTAAGAAAWRWLG